MAATVALPLDENIELASHPLIKKRRTKNRHFTHHWQQRQHFWHLPYLLPFLSNQLWVVPACLIGFFMLFLMSIRALSVPLNYILLVSRTVMLFFSACVVDSFDESFCTSSKPEHRKDFDTFLEFRYASVSFFDVKALIKALIVIGLFVYRLQSKRDFQSHWAAFFSLSMVFVGACLAHLLAQSAVFDSLIALLGAALFSIYSIFDAGRIMHQTSREDRSMHIVILGHY